MMAELDTAPIDLLPADISVENFKDWQNHTKSHRTKLQDREQTKSRVGQPRVRRRDAEQIRNPEVQRIYF